MVLLILEEKVELDGSMIFLEFLLTMLAVEDLEVATETVQIKLEVWAAEELELVAVELQQDKILH
jgi:hypothetical protein